MHHNPVNCSSATLIVKASYQNSPNRLPVWYKVNTVSREYDYENENMNTIVMQ